MIVIDPSGFPKKGADSCGVARQWCGRLGKKENCQSRRLPGLRLVQGARAAGPPALPAPGLGRRPGAPPGVPRPRGRGLPEDLGDRPGPAPPRAGRTCPTSWVVGDDEFGRASEFRAALRGDGERYVLDVPCNTNVRDLDARRPPRKKGRQGRASGRCRSCGSTPGPGSCRRTAGPG